MEYFWLVVGLVSSVFVGYTFYHTGWRENSILLILPVMSLMMFGIRRAYRKQQEKQTNRNEP